MSTNSQSSISSSSSISSISSISSLSIDSISSGDEDDVIRYNGEEEDRMANERVEEINKLQEDQNLLMAQRGQFEASSSNHRRRRRYVDRGRDEGFKRFYKDYFDRNPTFHGGYIRRRYRMRTGLFKRIVEKIVAHDPYFVQKKQCTGQNGIHPYIEIAAALKMMAYGVSADSCDEYLRLGESTTLECLRHFCAAVVDLFSVEYLREPNSDDIARLLKQNEERGFPGMLGSVDCMHWKWKNCPASWRGTYTDYKKHPSIVLEAVASYDCWIWHAFFGMPGSFNDVNVINVSGIFNRMLRGEMPSMPYLVNGTTYRTHYLLGDGIYPKWATIQKTVRDPQTVKEKRFAAFQEGCRKDIERAFGILQARWGIIKRPAESWSKETIHSIMLACIILHNMISQDEKDIDPCVYDTMKKDKDIRDKVKDKRKNEMKGKTMEGRYAMIVEEYRTLRDSVVHDQLKCDLMEHIWRESEAGNIRIG